MLLGDPIFGLAIIVTKCGLEKKEASLKMKKETEKERKRSRPRRHLMHLSVHYCLPWKEFSHNVK